MAKFEYIISGCAYLKLNYDKREFCLNNVNKALNHVQNKYNHNFGLLFNAYQEKRFGEAFQKYKENISSIHADSGGLQIITRGKTITEKLKNEIYQTQSRYSDIAMSFDEIPLKVLGNNSKNRYFDEDSFDWCARKSGQNLKNQIEYFIKHDSKSKPLLIVQGNCYESYVRWFDTLLKEIPEEYYEFIGGIASGGTACGTGIFEDVQRYFSISEMEFPDKMNKQIHLLGIGSVRRVIPLLIFLKNGLYHPDSKISYDSTTHSSGVSRGNYSINGRMISIGRHHNKISDYVFKDIQNNFKNFELDYNVYKNSMFLSLKDYNKFEHNSEDRDLMILLFCLSSLLDFAKTIEMYYNDLSLLKNTKMNVLMSLMDIKNKSDFDYWVQCFRRYVPSTNVPKLSKSLSLENFYA